MSFSPSLISSVDVRMIIIRVDEHISICVVQALPEPLKEQLCQATASKHVMASEIVSGFDVILWDGCPGGVFSG